MQLLASHKAIAAANGRPASTDAFQDEVLNHLEDIRIWVMFVELHLASGTGALAWFSNAFRQTSVHGLYRAVYVYVKDVENYVKVASLSEIEENDFNLNIPLYVEKIIEDNLPSVEEALSDLKTAWAESQKAEKKFKTILKDFI